MSRLANQQDRQSLTDLKCTCGKRIGGLESLKGGEPAKGVALGRFVRFQDGKVFTTCRCGKENQLPLRVHVVFPT